MDLTNGICTVIRLVDEENGGVFCIGYERENVDHLRVVRIGYANGYVQRRVNDGNRLPNERAVGSCGQTVLSGAYICDETKTKPKLN